MTLTLIPLALIVALSCLAPPLARRLGREAGYPLAAGFAAVAVWLGAATPRVVAGEVPDVSMEWIPSLGMSLSLGLDGLSLAFALLILGIGALVLAYSARYLGRGGGHGRFYGLLVLFAASMLGLVLARDIILLLVFWELTSITSFFLISGEGREVAARSAVRALLVTAIGGLALLVAFSALIVVTGTADIATILSDADVVRNHALGLPILALLLLGAFTKSAQFPFHFWLPGAMVAPTPVSTYLHAATMVKAGIYLLARFTPLYGGDPAWRYTIVLTGLATAVIGAAFALKQYDLKSLLAYSTVSQLGFICALVGVGTPDAIAAATIHTIAHAAYKATLFMVVGIIDLEAGSRDIRNLSGLRRMMPLTATVTGLAALSMAGFPPSLGFISKEEAFTAFLGAPGWLGAAAAVMAVTASVMTFGYGARIFDGAFGGPIRQRLYEPRISLLAPAALPAAAGIVLGAVVWIFDPLADEIVRTAVGVAGAVHLELWHGFEAALLMSAITIGLGFLLFLSRRRVDAITHSLELPTNGERVFDASHGSVIRAGELLGAPFTGAAPARHLAWILGATVFPVAWAWLYTTGAAMPSPPSLPEDWGVAALLALAIAAIVSTRTRLAAVALIGVTGFIVATVYVVFGAPDLALTQILVETLTVVVVVLVFRRLSARFRPVSLRRRIFAVAAALTVGTFAFLGAEALTGRPDISEVGDYYLEAAPAEAEGGNVVNTILVDFRALDTLGEIVVLAVAGLGVFGLLRRREADR